MTDNIEFVPYTNLFTDIKNLSEEGIVNFGTLGMTDFSSFGLPNVAVSNQSDESDSGDVVINK